MIPSNIERRHIIMAIRQIEIKGLPKGRESRKFSLIFDDKPYPPKYTISLANMFANGEELSPSLFNGGDETNSFLSSRGFKVVNKATPKSAAKPITSKKENPAKEWKRHDERCPDCKKAVGKMLREIYGRAESNYRFEASANVEGYSGTSFYNGIKKIFSALQNHRGHKVLVRTKNLPRCDFFVPNQGFIVEFDESQHFTLPRMISLQNYPKNFTAGFSIKRWMALCEEIDSKDNAPPFRDEQRAWYDTLRDFLPLHLGLKPTVRLYAGNRQWCSLDPKNPGDVAVSKKYIEMKQAKAKNWVATVLIQSDKNWFFSKLVVEGLVDFQSKVSQIMKTICLSLDDLDFVIHPFQLASVDGVIAVINDPVSVPIQHSDKGVDRSIVKGSRQSAPLIEGFGGPSS